MGVWYASGMEKTVVREVAKSARELVCAWGQWGWVVLIDLLGGMVGFYQMGNPNYSLGWRSLSVASVVGLVVAAFVAFHKIRKERDEIKARLAPAAARRELRAIMNEAHSILYGTGDVQSRALEWRNRAAATIRQCLGPDYEREFLASAASEPGPSLEYVPPLPEPGKLGAPRYAWDWARAKLKLHHDKIHALILEVPDADFDPKWLDALPSRPSPIAQP